jgi:hypothetical protein
MAAPVESVQGTGLTGAMEVVPDQPLPLSAMPNPVYPTFLIQLLTLDLIIVRQ